MDKCLKTYPRLGAKYIEPLTVGAKRKACYTNCMQKLKTKLFPSLDNELDDAEHKKQEECEIVTMKRQLNAMQNTLKEIQELLKQEPQSKKSNKERAFSHARNRLETL